MAFSEFVQIMIVLTIGCIVGLILALRSLQLRGKQSGIGLVALLLNGLPLILLVFLWLRR